MFKENTHTPVILTPLFKGCWDAVSSIHQDQRAHQPSNIAVLGVSGVGKSTLIRGYSSNFPSIKEKERIRIPVAGFRVPSAPTAKSLLQAINRMFSGSDSGSSADLMKRAVQYINHFGVEILFADEAHHLIDRGRMKSHAHLGDCWKEFNDQVRCSICMSGAPRLKLLFETNTQLKNRWSASYSLHPFAYGDDLRDLAQFIVTLMEPYSVASVQQFLLNADALNRIQYATDGVPAQVVQLLKRLMTLLGSGGELSMPLLDAAWCRCLPSTRFLPNHRRPFHAAFNFERLNGMDEPFYPSPFDGDNHAPYH
nr:TniB family NTP-binding protein [uncultured Rhodoferax sp.]